MKNMKQNIKFALKISFLECEAKFLQDSDRIREIVTSNANGDISSCMFSYIGSLLGRHYPLTWSEVNVDPTIKFFGLTMTFTLLAISKLLIMTALLYESFDDL